MKRPVILSIIFFFNYLIISAQDDNKVFEKVEINAGTDEKKWKEHLAKYSQLPDSVQAKIPGGTYKVLVEFIINKHGDLGGVKAKSDPGYGLAKKAESIIRSYKGQWQAASQCGRLVTAYRKESVVFVVSNQNSLSVQ